jgi:hypothetical protein
MGRRLTLHINTQLFLLLISLKLLLTLTSLRTVAELLLWLRRRSRGRCTFLWFSSVFGWKW